MPACKLCQKYLIDYDWGESTGSGQPRTYQSGPTEYKPIERRADQPPPCAKCPKKSPEQEHEHVLTEANYQALAHYREVKAMGFRGISDEEATDAVVRRNFVLLDQVFDGMRERRQRYAAMAPVNQLLRTLGR